MTAQDGKQAELLEILVEAAELLKENKDCLQYIVGKLDDSKTVWINEAWTSKEAHDASLESTEIRELVMSALPLLEGMPEKGTEFTVVGGKWL